MAGLIGGIIGVIGHFDRVDDGSFQHRFIEWALL